MPLPSKSNKSVEGLKLWYDTMKHLTTICTGTLVLLVSFVEKIFRENTKWKFLFPIVLMLLLLSVLSALFCMLYLSEVISDSEGEIDVEKEKWLIKCYLISLASFFLGLLALVIFTIANFI